MSEKKKAAKKNGGGSSTTGGGAASAGARGSSPMDLGVLEQMIKLMAANDVSAVDIRDGDKRIILKRGQQNVVQYAAPAGYMPAPPPAAPSSTPAAAASPTAAPAADETAGMLQIKSPMVGTFYAAPAPDAKPFVSVGSRVDDETDVCVIEAMKVFNNIKAECKGTIAKMMVTNGQTVEFGQVLFLVKP